MGCFKEGGIMNNFEKCETILDQLNTMRVRARSENSKRILWDAMETIEHLATCLDDANDRIEDLEREFR